jgi:prepilin-type N-terminal cleavage/methylation domain-containing protein
MQTIIKTIQSKYQATSAEVAAEQGAPASARTSSYAEATKDMTAGTAKHDGFTFIETLVAITVLLVAVVAPMSLASDGIIASRLAQDQIVAFYLGQEGVEAVKNMRDHNRLTNDGDGQLGNISSGNLSDCMVSDPDTDEGCMVDVTRMTDTGTFWTQGCNGGCEPMRLSDTAPFVYSHQTTGTSCQRSDCGSQSDVDICSIRRDKNLHGA